MSARLENQTKALAGIFQACELVRQIAWTGRCNADDLHTSLNSLMITDADTVDEIYGDIEHLQAGLKCLIANFSQPKETAQIEITRYTINLLYLQKRLVRNKGLSENLNQGITAVTSQLSQFDITHKNTIAKLADIYQKTISSMKPRILVNGEQLHLSNPDNANRVRALLLAGIRSAVLYRQCKGSKIKLLFSYKRYRDIAEELLKTI